MVQRTPTVTAVDTNSNVTMPIPKVLTPVSSRPRRTICKPLRYRDSDHVNPDVLSFSDSDGCRKVKRILAQRHTSEGFQYLVQVVGEPAQNAAWVSASVLNAKARQNILTRPPPVI